MPAPAPLPWHKRYRLLVQLGGLLVLGGLVAAIAVILVSGDDGAAQRLASHRLRENLTPLMESILVAPADLPADWEGPGAGLGIQANLRQTDLGHATAVARSIVGSAAGWTDPGAISLLSSGVIVADSPGLARAAFDRLSAATPDEVLAFIEPGADELVSLAPISLDRDPADQFALVITYARGIANPEAFAAGEDPEPFLISVTVHMVVTARSLIFVAFNTVSDSPPLPVPVDLDAWLGDLVLANQIAEQRIALTPAE